MYNTAMSKPIPTVYLAGPISGCTDAEKRAWRDDVKRKYSDMFRFVDPLDSNVGEDAYTSKKVTQDRKDIERCDAVLANMWKPSLGTAIGVVLARTKGKVVVMVDPAPTKNPILAHYCDGWEATVPDGIKILHALFENDYEDMTVVKKNGRETTFRRTLLMKSIRQACNTAGVDDVTFPPMILADILEEIQPEAAPPHSGREKQIQTQGIADAVLRALDRASIRRKDSDPDFTESSQKVRDVWRARMSEEKPARRSATTDSDAVAAALISPAPLNVGVTSEKSHHNIWGTAIRSLDDLPSEVQTAFREVIRVRGIKLISLTAFKAKDMSNAPQHVRIEVAPDANPDMIKGVMHHRGKIGHTQNFQIHLSEPERRDDILAALARLLTPVYMNE